MGFGATTVGIACVGDENVALPSHREINAVRGKLGDDVWSEWVATGSRGISDLSRFDGVWLVPGSPYADHGAAYAAVKWAREEDVPFLGTCGGLQYAVVEYFRNVLGLAEASHAESDGVGAGNVVSVLACSLMGEERVVRPIAGTRFSELVGDEAFVGMHYCGYAPVPAADRRAGGKAAAPVAPRVRRVRARAGCPARSGGRRRGVEQREQLIPVRPRKRRPLGALCEFEDPIHEARVREDLPVEC